MRIICLALGLLLLTAAGLKLYDYSLDGVSRWAFLSSARLYMAVIAAEGGLGLWLLIGHPTRLLWFVAILFFAALAGVSVYLALAGQPSCGCFGKLAVSPWYSFSLDMLAVAALVFCRPQLIVYADTEGGVLHPSRTFLRRSLSVAAGSAIILAAILGGLTWMYGSPSAALRNLRGESVTVDPPVSDLGPGPSGETRTFTILLTNRTDHPIRIIGGSSDCSCVATDELPLVLPAGEARPLKVRARFVGKAGSIARIYRLHTDDAIQPVIVARLTGMVVEPP